MRGRNMPSWGENYYTNPKTVWQGGQCGEDRGIGVQIRWDLIGHARIFDVSLWDESNWRALSNEVTWSDKESLCLPPEQQVMELKVEAGDH